MNTHENLAFLRFPSRDANDADHLSLMLLVGGLASIYYYWIGDRLDIVWCIFGISSVVAAPLLWTRRSHAKWGGVIAAGIFVFITARSGIPDSIIDSIALLGSILLVYWFYKIDYSHQFDLDE